MTQGIIDFGNYGISAEQSCILCHLSSECGGCCASCHERCSNSSQLCSRPMRDVEGSRWNSWMYLIKNYEHIKELAKKVIPAEMRKKYNIDKLIRYGEGEM